MQWIIKYLTSSIGKKQIMGCTGAFLALFIFGHMCGNFQLLNFDQAARTSERKAFGKDSGKEKNTASLLHIIRIIKGALGVLKEFHNAGYLHLDISPDNILLVGYEEKDWLQGYTLFEISPDGSYEPVHHRNSENMK